MNKELKILIIQTAYIGDVILATSLVDYTKKKFPNSKIHFVLRKGNESITNTHENIYKTWIWDKQGGKYSNLFKLAFKLRKENFDVVLNIQRFFNSGLLTLLSGAKVKIGFDKNPLSFLFNKKVVHKIPYDYNGEFLHEVQRNFLLLNEYEKECEVPNPLALRPSIKPTSNEIIKIENLIKGQQYLVMAPASVWFTKQWPKQKWIELVKKLHSKYTMYFIGAPGDIGFINEITNGSENCYNLAGKLNLRESAQLMKNATRVFVNDSAPLHLASAMNAKVTAIFCSTISEFGYTPICDDFKVISLEPRKECMPCGLHGKKACPLRHFDCGYLISIDDVIATI